MMVQSMGAGVQSTCVALLYIDKLDKVVFADVGDEWPETYEYIQDYLKPHCGNKWVTVRYDKRYDSLSEHCIQRNVIPMRRRRWCTQDYKVKPLNKYYRDELGATKKNPCTMMIGFSTDEAHRVNTFKFYPKYVQPIFPLIHDNISRAQCGDIIRENGWPIPPKSGCYFCPFQGKKKYRELRAKHPELFERALQIEENGKSFPKHTLHGTKKLRVLVDTNTESLDKFIEDDMCDSGYCMT